MVKRISRATGQLLANDMLFFLLFHPVVNTRNELPNPCSHSLEQWAGTKSEKRIQLTDASVRNISPFHMHGSQREPRTIGSTFFHQQVRTKVGQKFYFFLN